MKKLLIFAAISVMAASHVSAASPLARRAPKQALSEIAKTTLEVRKLNKAASEGVWRPGKIVGFEYDDGVWEQTSALTCTYLPNGLLSTKGDGSVITAYTYDDMHRISEVTIKQAGNPDATVASYALTYDPVVTDVIIKTSYTISMAGFTFTSVEGLDITRDDAGNVVKVVEYEQSPDEGREIESVLEIEYGADGKASKITEKEYSDGVPEYTGVISGIEWETTDGQIITLEEDSYAKMPLFTGANKIRSATCDDSDMMVAATLTASYPADGYKVKVEMNGATLEDIYFREVDEYGSYRLTEYSVDYDYNEATGKWERDEAETLEAVFTVDKYGLMLEDTEIYTYESPYEPKETYSKIGHVAYNSQHGYPDEYWVEESENGRFELESKEVYSDYRLYGSGVTEIEPSAADGQPEYYNLQGVRMSHPGKGIYIERRGNRSKLILTN